MKEKEFVIVIVLFLTLIVVSTYMYYKTEKFNILGALAPYKKQLVQCIRECNREDPDTRLLQSGNFNCSVYCESVLTDMARRGVPPENVKILTTSDKCEKQCSGKYPNVEKNKCIGVCKCHNNVYKWCNNQCRYSTSPKHECMKDCGDVYLTNCNQTSWDWRTHG